MIRVKLVFVTVTFLVVGAVALFFVRGLLESPRPGRAIRSGGSIRPESDNAMRANLMPNELANRFDEQPTETHIETASALVSYASENSNIDQGWTRFRGPNGTGVSSATVIPTTWGESSNLIWKTKIPGPGSSSPVLSDDSVFLTSYTGYGEEDFSGGRLEDLKRHLHCIDRKTGEIVWTRSVNAVLPEDRYSGMGVPEHGYATNSPVTDGKKVYAFFGKSGVFAYDVQGNELWQANVGNESGNRGWGTASSLILYRNLVIVNASEESQALFALDKDSGEVVWKAPASILELAYGTPIIARVDEQRDDLVLAVPGEVWGLNPNTGKLVWFATTTLTGNLSPSVIADGDRVYVFGGYRSSGSLAIQMGGIGDVTKSHILWTSRNSSYVVTPILLDDRLIWIDDQGMYFCIAAKSGELIEKKRVPDIESRGRKVYASPVAIGGKLYMQTRHSGVFVLSGEPGYQLISQNRFESDDSVFNATPAVDGDRLFLRSYRSLYCIGTETKE